MPAFKQRLRFWRTGVAMAAVVGLLGPGTASAASFELRANHGQHLVSVDPEQGLTSWTVHGTEFLTNQRYFIRRGDGNPEEDLGDFFDSAEQRSRNTVVADYDLGNLAAQTAYSLRRPPTSGMRSHLDEKLTIRSPSAGGYEGSLDVFLYADFDLTDFEPDALLDTIDDTGTASRDGARQFDGDLVARYFNLRVDGETGADRYEIDAWPNILDKLTDGDADNLEHTAGSETFGPGHVEFAHQFSLDIERGQQLNIRGTKTVATPTPSAIGGGLFLLGGLALRRRRRHTPRR